MGTLIGILLVIAGIILFIVGIFRFPQVLFRGVVIILALFFVFMIIATILDHHAENAEKRKQKKAEKEQRKREAEQLSAMPQDAQGVVAESKALLKKIEKSNKAITNSTIKKVTGRIVSTTNQILKEVLRSPEKATRIQKLNNYYLPTTLKLVDQYSVYEQRKLDGQKENTANMMSEIKEALITVDQALKKYLVDFNTYDDMDVSSEISVLKQQVNRDGLA